MLKAHQNKNLKEDFQEEDTSAANAYADAYIDKEENDQKDLERVDDVFDSIPGDEAYDEELDALIYEEIEFSIDDSLEDVWATEDSFLLSSDLDQASTLSQ